MGELAAGGDQHRADKAHPHRRQLAAAERLAEQGHAQQGEHQRPAVVEGHGDLPGQQAVGREQDQVVEEGVEQAEQGGAHQHRSRQGAQLAELAAAEEDEQQRAGGHRRRPDEQGVG